MRPEPFFREGEGGSLAERGRWDYTASFPNPSPGRASPARLDLSRRERWFRTTPADS